MPPSPPPFGEILGTGLGGYCQVLNTAEFELEGKKERKRGERTTTPLCAMYYTSLCNIRQVSVRGVLACPVCSDVLISRLCSCCGGGVKWERNPRKSTGLIGTACTKRGSEGVRLCLICARGAAPGSIEDLRLKKKSLSSLLKYTTKLLGMTVPSWCEAVSYYRESVCICCAHAGVCQRKLSPPQPCRMHHHVSTPLLPYPL
ncbi:hypothetical protein GGS23DRAFT_260314 [Durotheca rogersii]|uniref:uncharacterized protein n=1 Tax=Durotheca rogersii TaxID=419775 RepID=UPI00222092F2|nr:uncharacterized protein GGS23DRAFT_260314 [Durotheca rogersii]KAI5859779.1 hypothetical protein GGS23DRAFT_260314 [Durotheca rogersii]